MLTIRYTERFKSITEDLFKTLGIIPSAVP